MVASKTDHSAPFGADDGPLPITIYSDVICPWCYVGKRRFEKALTAPGMPQQLAITWRPFELNPDMPAEGRERAAYRASKFGPEKARQLDQQMTETGREVGIAFTFDKQPRTPNTRLAHRLIWQVERQGMDAQNALVDRLFEAYFEQGLDIGRTDVLLELASAAGLDPGETRNALGDDASLEAVLDLEAAGVMTCPSLLLSVLTNKHLPSFASSTNPAEIMLHPDALSRSAPREETDARAIQDLLFASDIHY